MSKFRVGDRVSYQNTDFEDEFVMATVTGYRAAESDIEEDGYTLKWDDGWVDDPEVYYYDSELKKAE